MLKRYYFLDEAADYLSSQSGQRITLDNVFELVVRGEIRLCVWFEGEVIACTNDPESFDGIKIFPDIRCSFRGYIQIPKSCVSVNWKISLFDGIKIIEAIEVLEGDPENGLPPFPEFFWGLFFTSKIDVLTIHRPFHPELSTCESLLIPAQDILALTAKRGKETTLTDRAETTYLNIIGGLLDLMLGKSPAGKPHSVFENQSKIIESLLAHYEGKQGISSRTLEEKFAEAKRRLKSN